MGIVTQEKYDFRWEVLDVIISGKSAIDSSQGFDLHSIDEVTRFVASYGYDLENPIENLEVLGNYREAVNFVRRYFLQPDNPDGLRLEIPRRLLEITDIRDLFLMASGCFPGQTHDGSWTLIRNFSCAVLKVMHTIAHIDKDLRTPHFSDIQQQIFDRFYKVIHRDAQGGLFLGDREGDPRNVNLVAFETKPKKGRDSILLKLLHKPENVAEDIFDRVGIRFVTHSRLDALRVVKYLKDNMIVMPPNIKPSRSRNTLVDLEHFKGRLIECRLQGERGDMDEDSLTHCLEEAACATRANPDNPHSSEYYRSIQFTCRQLIKLRNPLFDDLKELKGLARAGTVSEDVMRVSDRIDLKNVQREIRFFYPFEVQIMDKLSAEENEKGLSAHSEYKKAQIQTALRRVMGALVDAVR